MLGAQRSLLRRSPSLGLRRPARGAAGSGDYSWGLLAEGWFAADLQHESRCLRRARREGSVPGAAVRHGAATPPGTARLEMQSEVLGGCLPGGRRGFLVWRAFPGLYFMLTRPWAAGWCRWEIGGRSERGMTRGVENTAGAKRSGTGAGLGRDRGEGRILWRNRGGRNDGRLRHENSFISFLLWLNEAVRAVAAVNSESAQDLAAVPA